MGRNDSKGGQALSPGPERGVWTVQRSGMALSKVASSSIDQLIAWAAVDPDKVIEEFNQRGILTTDGRTIGGTGDLRSVHRSDSRKVAKRYIKTYSQLAAGQGFVTGLGGLITLPASMPTDAAAYVWWLARTASAVQLSYGFPTRTETGDAQLKLALLAGAGVSSVTVEGSEVLVAHLARRVLRAPYAQAPIQAAIRAVAAKAGIQVTRKSLAKAVPIVGGAVNGGVHGTLVYLGGVRILNYYEELVRA